MLSTMVCQQPVAPIVAEQRRWNPCKWQMVADQLSNHVSQLITWNQIKLLDWPVQKILS